MNCQKINKSDEHYYLYKTHTFIVSDIEWDGIEAGFITTNVSGTEDPRSAVEKIKMRVVMRIINQFIFSRSFHLLSSNMSHRMQCTKVALYNP
jgi:hypothetical protein